MLNFILLPLSGGENQYLGFAKQFMNPDWIQNSFSLNEFPGTRLLFQYLFGWPLNFIDIEEAALVYRCLNYILISFPLALIAKKLKLKLFETALVIQVFCTGQSLLGGEWMIGTFEPKTIAYVFFLWAFYFYLIGKYYRLVIMAALACYFHIIVGGWFLIGLAFVALWQANWKQLIRPAIVFLLLIAPFLYYLRPLFLNTAEEGNPSANFIYVYYRLPHHLGIASSWDYFVEYHLNDVLITLFSFSLIFFIRKRPELSQIYRWILVGFGISLLYVPLSLIDGLLLDRSASFGLKYYPFRLNSFAYFLLLIAMIKYLQGRKYFKINTKVLFYSFATITAVIAISRLHYGYNKRTKYYANQHYFDLIENVRSQGKPSDSYILNFKNYENEFYSGFSLLTGRENFAVYKFVPADPEKIYEWHNRQMQLKALRLSKEKASKICDENNLQYLISENKCNEDQFDLVYNNDDYYLYRYLGND